MDEYDRMKYNNKDTVCTYPWNSVYIDGSIKLCCNSLTDMETDAGEKPTFDDLDTILSGKSGQRFDSQCLMEKNTLTVLVAGRWNPTVFVLLIILNFLIHLKKL